MIAAALARVLRRVLLLPVVALASYYLMAALPLPSAEDAKRQLPKEVLTAYRKDLGIGEPLGFLRPWQKLFAGERLGTSAQGVTFPELLEKLGGSLWVGLIALGLSLVWALAYALLRASSARKQGSEALELLPAIAFGTPVFIPALLLAPAVVETGGRLPELAAALVLSAAPGVLWGRMLAQALLREQVQDDVRTARSKGASPGRILWRHVLPNLWPVLLDALPPTATALLAGSFAAERVLGLPYFGQLYVAAVLQKQLAVVVVATTLFAAILVVVSAATDVVRLVVDPRAAEREP